MIRALGVVLILALGACGDGSVNSSDQSTDAFDGLDLGHDDLAGTITAVERSGESIEVDLDLVVGTVADSTRTRLIGVEGYLGSCNGRPMTADDLVVGAAVVVLRSFSNAKLSDPPRTSGDRIDCVGSA